MVWNNVEDGTSQPLFALKNVALFLRSTSNQSDNLTSLVNFIATVKMLVHEPSLINAHLSSEMTNVVQRDLVVLVNQIVVYSSREAVKAGEREIRSVIILVVINDGIINQFL